MLHNAAVFIWHRTTKTNREVNAFFTNLCNLSRLYGKSGFVKRKNKNKNKNLHLCAWVWMHERASEHALPLPTGCSQLTGSSQIAWDPAVIPSQQELLIIWRLSLTSKNRGARWEASKAQGNPSARALSSCGCGVEERGNFYLLLL